MAKGKKEGASKKEVEKKVNKIVEDKTFGVSFPSVLKKAKEKRVRIRLRQEPRTIKSSDEAERQGTDKGLGRNIVTDAAIEIQLKNKNKSKKVQQYVQQVQNVARAQKTGEVRSAEWYAAQEAKKKKEREEKKQLEKEMMALLGKDYQSAKQQKKKEEEEKKKEEERKKEEAQQQYEHDFGVPITTLDQVFRVDGKAVVNRVCGELVWKDNLVSRTKDGAKECVYCKISDGSTRLPLPMTLIGWTPSTFTVKQGAVVDVRDAVAMVRGGTVDLEVTNGAGTIAEASSTLAEHILQMKQEAEELRERGGIPIEELIEEQRAKLKFSELTPLTAERFLEWKAKKLKAKQEAKEKERKELEAKQAKGGANVLSGRALFSYDPTLFQDDEAAENKYEVEEAVLSSEEEGDGQGEDGNDEEEERGEEEKNHEDGENPIEEEPDVDLDALEDEEDEK